MIKYDVCVGYNHFIFDNSEEAVIFAEQSKQHYRDRRDDDIEVSITIKAEKETEEE